ncbi:MAG: glycosyltransferase family 4 protein [Comamonadaceae bacterium]|nr:glycosyltransferase family 4 protein [Comamonadaceae bacterium]
MQAGRVLAAAVLPGDGPLRPALEAAGAHVDVHNLGVIRRRYFTPAGLVNRAAPAGRCPVGFLSRTIREQRIDVVHSNTTAVFAGALAARRCGVPHVRHVHEITARPRWYAALVSRLLGALVQPRRHGVGCDAAPPRRAEPGAGGQDGRRSTTASTRRARSAGCAAACASAHGWPADAVVVGMIGRINWWKGQGALLDSATALLAERDDLRFLLVGGVFAGEEGLREGLLRARSTRSARAPATSRSRISARTSPACSPTSTSSCCRRSSPIRFRPSSLEAMAAAKPVVAFDHGGVVEMVDGGRVGMLCPPVSVPALASAIGLLADSADERQAHRAAGERARRRAGLAPRLPRRVHPRLPRRDGAAKRDRARRPHWSQRAAAAALAGALAPRAAVACPGPGGAIVNGRGFHLGEVFKRPARDFADMAAAGADLVRFGIRLSGTPDGTAYEWPARGVDELLRTLSLAGERGMKVVPVLRPWPRATLAAVAPRVAAAQPGGAVARTGHAAQGQPGAGGAGPRQRGAPGR